MLDDRFTCPVCGNDGLYQPMYYPVDGIQDPTYEICPCCKFESGFTDDAEGYSIEQWRCRWIRDGMRWSWREPPPGWDPRAQLRRIGIEPPPPAGSGDG